MVFNKINVEDKNEKYCLSFPLHKQEKKFCQLKIEFMKNRNTFKTSK